MASHRMPDSDRPRRPVPAWVTAPPVDGQEARPASASSPAVAPVAESVAPVAGSAAPVASPVGSVAGPAAAAPTPTVAGPASAAPPVAGPPVAGPVAGGASSVTDAALTPPAGEPVAVPDPAADVLVPDFPPEEHLLPPAPTSPAVHTLPFDRLIAEAMSSAPAPVSPIDAAPAPRPKPTGPVVPAVGQPRFSVPGLEHVVVQGTEPEPSGPVGFRTPARFAQHQAQSTRPPAPAPTPDAADAAAALTLPSAPTPAAPAPTTPAATDAPPAPVDPASGHAATEPGARPTKRAPRSRGAARTKPARRTRGAAGSGVLATVPPEATVPTQTESSLPAGGVDAPEAGRAPAATTRRLGVTPGAVLGAVAGVGTLGLAAWWFTAPATVHAVGVVLGLLALVLSIATLRDRAATWQRPVALLGAVLGAVGTLVLLWAVASAVLPAAGVTLPDLTGSGTVPTIAP